MPAHVRGHDVEAVVEVPRERIEGLGARRVAVDAHHRRRAAIAPVEVVQVQTVVLLPRAPSTGRPASSALMSTALIMRFSLLLVPPGGLNELPKPSDSPPSAHPSRRSWSPRWILPPRSTTA